VDEDDSELVKNDPESEAAYELLRDVIAEELFVRIEMGEQLISEADAVAKAELIADAVLWRFRVSERREGEPRYSWRK